MKLGPVTKQYERNKTTSKIFDEVMSANCNVSVIFRFLANLGQIQKPDSSSIVYKTYIFINSNLLSKKMLTSAKLRGS